MAEPEDETVDYVVVGSGAGGGTVAARLAEAGMSVLVLEAGADPATLRAKGLPEDYDGSRVPSVRLGKQGDGVELPRPRLRRRRRAAGPASTLPGGPASSIRAPRPSAAARPTTP